MRRCSARESMRRSTIDSEEWERRRENSRLINKSLRLPVELRERKLVKERDEHKTLKYQLN